MVSREERLGDSEEGLRLAQDSHAAQLWTALPAIVQSVNLAAMTITAQPTIQGLVKDNAGNVKAVNLPILGDVPICFPSAGGFTLTLPIKAGDEVLIVFAARPIDSWFQSGGIGKQVERRMQDLSDGFAIPGPRSQPRVIGDISSTAAQLRSDDGTTFIEVAPGGKVKLTAPTSVTIDTPITYFTGQIANIAGTYGGDFDAVLDGNLTVLQNIHSDGDTTAGSISLETHVHNGVQPGGGDTGPPV